MDRSRSQSIEIPQELVDMIVDRLAGDCDSLKSCSLVSRRWRPRCRYQLFKVVVFADSLPRQPIARWCATFGHSRGTFASLTKELHFRQQKRFWISPVGLSHYLPHLAHFVNVRTLVFSGFATSAFNAESLSRCFGSFLSNVQHLRFHCPVSRPVSLIKTISLFTGALDVEIRHPRWSIAEGEEGFPIHSFPGSLQLTGTLHLRGFCESWGRFFELLSAQPLKFKKLGLVGCGFSSSFPTQCLLDAASPSVRNLRLIGFGSQRTYSGITLEALSVLENLGLNMTCGGARGAELARILDSISSPHFSVLVLDVGDRERYFVGNGRKFAKRFLDDTRAINRSLHRLAARMFERVGKRFTLILLGNNPAEIARSFGKFGEVGNTWEGERVIGNGRSGCYWTFRPAGGHRTELEVDESVLDLVTSLDGGNSV